MQYADLADIECTSFLPATGKFITAVSEATREDVDRAVEAAKVAFDTVWGHNSPGSLRAKLLYNLADAIEMHKEELAALEALDNGELIDFFT